MKKILFVLGALIVTAASLAFIPQKPKQKNTSPVLYIYQQSTTSGEDNAMNYVQATQEEVDQLGCESGSVICWILFDDDPNSVHPPLPSNFDPRTEAYDFREKN